MAGKLSGQIMETGFLTGTKARVLLALASVSDRHGQSWYSYAGLAHLARCSRKSAIEAVKWMEMTWILSVRRGRITERENPFPKPVKIGNASRWSLIEIIE